MTQNKLKLNDAKTDIILCSTSTKINTLDVDHLSLATVPLPFPTKLTILVCLLITTFPWNPN